MSSESVGISTGAEHLGGASQPSSGPSRMARNVAGFEQRQPPLLPVPLHRTSPQHGQPGFRYVGRRDLGRGLGVHVGPTSAGDSGGYGGQGYRGGYRGRGRGRGGGRGQGRGHHSPAVKEYLSYSS